MGKAPAVIIIARHGARLDAIDKHWSESAAAPYDPPLSYGGWTQTRALGARIASLLRERDIALNEAERRASRPGPDHAQADCFPDRDAFSPRAAARRRKRKVVIHSSPFLRCVQSSIGISAGMAQYQGNLKRFEAAHDRQERRPRRVYTAPTRSFTLDPSVLEANYNHKPAPAQAHEHQTAAHDHLEDAHLGPWKPTLRIDAFLGEWLSPTYYELTTAPPPSNMMVAGAKADLIRPSSPIIGSQVPAKTNVHPHTRASSTALDLPELGEALPSFDGDSTRVNPSASSHARVRRESVSQGYLPPAPNYAILATATIPRGYVAHARESCIRLDYAWDSMREPQSWGDGGTFGEEWASMHTRFRRGLADMVSWYRSHSIYLDPQAWDNDDGQDPDQDEDLIVILVTHSAGCNALIGAITNHPVLLDVGMASLTMAVHKGPGENRPAPHKSSSGAQRRSSSVDLTHTTEYEMKMTASMEHLRGGADPLKIPALQSPHLSAIPESGAGRATAASSDGTLTPELDLELAGPTSSALGSILLGNRSTTVGPAAAFAASAGCRKSTTGLWGSQQHQAAPALTEQLHTKPSRENSCDRIEREEDEMPSPLATMAAGVARTNSKRGLWGGGRKAQPARRWTMNEPKI